MTSAQSPQAAAKRFDIPAQPLAIALQRFMQQSGVQLSYPSDLATGRMSGAVGGTMSAGEALSRLLAGTGLTYRFVSPTAVTLEPAPRSGNAIELGPVRVEGAGGSAAAPGVFDDMVDTATGPLTGFAATRTGTATKTDTSIILVPQSVSVVGRDEMAARGAQTIEEALFYTPGVITQRNGQDIRSYEFIQLRGFNGLNQSYRDGLKQFTGVYWISAISDPYALERVEVLRGPSSGMFGQMEAGGLVNRISKRPGGDPVREIEVQLGSYDQRRIAADFGGIANAAGDVHYRIVGMARKGETSLPFADGYRPRQDRYFLAPSLLWKMSDRTALTVFLETSRDTSRGHAFYTPVPGSAPVAIADHSFSRVRQIQHSAGYELRHAFAGGWTFQQNLRFQTGSFYDQYMREQDVVGTISNRIPTTADETADQLSLDNHFAGAFSTGSINHKVLMGSDYIGRRSDYDARTSEGVSPLDLTAPQYGLVIPKPELIAELSRVRSSQIGFYLQDQVMLASRVMATVGGRVDHADEKFRTNGTTARRDDTALSGRAALSYLLGTTGSVYASYSTSFLPQSGRRAGGRPFEPTRGRQYEVGAKWQSESGRLLLTGALFDLTKTNVPTVDPADPAMRVLTGAVRSRGIELEAKGQVVDGLNILFSYSYNDLKIVKSNDGDQGKVPLATPDETFAAWLDHTPGFLDGLTLGAGVRYVGTSFQNDARTSKAPAYTLVDASIRYDLGKWRLSVNATNLLDRKYGVLTNYYDTYYHGPRRQVNVVLRRRFS